jgi:diguanylate cyclase (GGDEF)-like protein
MSLVKIYEVTLLTMQLEQAAHHDHLTDLLTRMRFYQRCDEEAESLYPASLLLLDIACFKLVNDRHGHAAGDSALKMVSRAIR